MTHRNLAKLNVLRLFRDKALLPTEIGRKLTGWYYALSPPLAEQIRHRPAAKGLVRLLLVDPLSRVAGDLAGEEKPSRKQIGQCGGQ